MVKKILLWVIAFVITATVAIYQRATGPTYPLKGQIELNSHPVSYTLYRSHGGTTDHEIAIAVNDPAITGKVYWRLYKYETGWREIEMQNHLDTLRAALPSQPKAGKIEYYLEINDGAQSSKLPEEENVVIRFKGDVPLWILIPHVIAMFGAMFLSMRTGLEFFVKDSRPFNLTYWTIGFLIVGGFILGPLVQWYAFDAFWTGFPFGYDLTDNKTLIALLGWLIALFMMRRSEKPKTWALIASLVLIAVYLIPHSVMGSEFDYSKSEKNPPIEKIND